MRAPASGSEVPQVGGPALSDVLIETDASVGGRRDVLLAVLGSAPVVVVGGLFLLGGALSLGLISFWQVRRYEIVPLWTLANYVEVLTTYLPVMIWTLVVATVVALLTTVASFPFAYVATFRAGPRREVLVFLLLLTIFSGYLVKVYAMKTVLGAEGLVNSFLMSLGVIREPLSFLIYSPSAVIMTLTNTLIPLAVLPLFAALQNVPYSLVEASKDLGAGRWKTLRYVTLPLARPGIVSAFAITFVLAAGDYVTPQLLGGKSGLMVGQVIASRFGVALDWPVGSALAFTTVAASLLVIWLFAWGTRVAMARRP